MSSVMSGLRFNGMALLFQVRDFVRPRKEILDEARIRPGFRVLDYGCGPGGYVVAAAGCVGSTGKVYALDVHPLAVRRVRDLAARRQLDNVEAIQSDCRTGLPDGSIDVVLLYDVYHALAEPAAVLAELRRVLKPGGRLSFSDHHLSEDAIISGVTGGQWFVLAGRGEHTYDFVPQKD